MKENCEHCGKPAVATFTVTEGMTLNFVQEGERGPHSYCSPCLAFVKEYYSDPIPSFGQ